LRFGDARFGARPVAASHFGKARRCAFGRRVLGDLVHLRNRHEHAIAAGIAQVEIVLRGTQNRFRAQSQVLTDAMYRVHDVIADAQVGERNRNALLNRANFDALGWCAEDFAVTEHA
jgi:hypothetical protein